ncbi:molybdopterin synthase catalytic subunit [Jeotgalicoccus coquinae]|uniref:Molybdopterin synthase catalytic subunit n=1 Tax=Jeotgalicoccus coquinae TaxID=709509 RepID=A0A6V7RM38_9STAP|nr:molybdenum cofactor biosynthesis protein MoaE [Jeotgalicoccus coquinae]MBB6422170.1 molybdopterin synthase catalytic subunit [Jeotgalicoccus coquinae]GGE18085.1 molybdopterin synthase catalytic subunit [Jeotgalicoccus coquinae]CAD2079428.1 Molybdopterin synthase catalytic subunit [Jeotgalicoccus coquinae]
MKMFEVTFDELDINNYHRMTVNEHQGAVCTFTGHVREWTKGTRTVHLEYEAYIPMAEKMLAQIGDEISERWPGVITAIGHRIGKLEISDIAVVIVTSSPHRTDSYRANEYAVERLKEIVPIWKKEIWEDGEEWIGDSRKYHPSVEGK